MRIAAEVVSRDHMTEISKYGPSWKHCPASPIQSCLWFPSRWKFGFDLQGTEKNMNLFKRKTTLQKAVCSKEPLATVFCYFWL